MAEIIKKTRLISTDAQGNTIIIKPETDADQVYYGNTSLDTYINNHKIEFIRGTQTAATASMTGVSGDSELYDGKTIFYYMPFTASTNATLNLTLSNGTTTGAKPVFYTGTSRMGNTYAQHSVIALTYLSDKDGWYRADLDTNGGTANQTFYSAAGFSLTWTSAGLYGYNDASSKYVKLVAGAVCNLDHQIICAAAASTFYYEGGNANINSTTELTKSFAVRDPLFLVGTLSGTTFTVDSLVITNTLPSSEDGKVYIFIGEMASTTVFNFHLADLRIFHYKNGTVQLYSNNDKSVKFVEASITNEYINGSDYTDLNIISTLNDGTTITKSLDISGTIPITVKYANIASKAYRADSATTAASATIAMQSYKLSNSVSTNPNTGAPIYNYYNVGSDNNPVYFKNGIPINITGTIGSASRPVYINNGVITAGNSIPSIPNLSVTSSGTGDAVTDITVSGHKITFTKGGDFADATHNHDSSYLGKTAKAVSATTADTATTATKVGTATVGSTSKPVYINGGTPTALTATVGSTDIPVYLNGGTITSTGKSFANYVPTSRKINNKVLSADISLTATDVGAATSTHNHDTVYATKAELEAVEAVATSAYHYKGTVTAVAALPSTGNKEGDVYNVGSSLNGGNYAWTGSAWDKLGDTVDLSGYVPTSRKINNKTLAGDITLSASEVGALASTAKAVSATTADKIGTGTVGSGTKPIFISGGTPTALSATIGTATKPVYLNGGVITACNDYPTIPNLSVTSTGTGNAVTGITVSGHTITFTKGTTFPTSVPTIPNLSVTSTGTGNAVTGITVSGHTITFAKETTFPTTNTTYADGSKALLDTGTDTTSRVWKAKDISDYVTGKGYITTYTNTTYAAGTTALLNTGTDTANRVWTAKGIADYVTGKIPSIPNVSITSTGSGNVISDITASGHTITLTKSNITVPTIPNLSITSTGTGDAVTDITVAGHKITFTKGGDFADATHNHDGVYLKVGAKAVSATSADTATTATKVGTGTVGSGTKPIYISGGTPTAFSATVGSSTKPVYLNGGVLTPCDDYPSVPTIPNLSVTSSGTGNVISNITVSGHTITFTKGVSALTSHQTIPNISVTSTGTGNAVTEITASGHTLTLNKGASYATTALVSTTANGLAPKITNTNGYLKGDGTWSTITIPNVTVTTAGTGNAISSITASGHTITANLVSLPTTNTTYGVVSTTANGLAPKITNTAGYLKGDGTWSVPPNDNTTYASGTTALLNTGTDTANRVWTAKAIADYVVGKGYITTYTNTTYAAGTAALLTTGSDTANRVWSSKILADYVKSMDEVRVTTVVPTTANSTDIPNGSIIICLDS